MSSLAASRADNFYFPPEWRPEYGGISKFAGSKGANQYEKFGIIRFEMPMDAWCLHCQQHLSKGLRFNAKKEKAGAYFSTTIWQFTMKCYQCASAMVIRTDPQHDTYEFVEGIRKHEQDYDPSAHDETVIITSSDETKQLLQQDPIFRLEHETEMVRKIETEQERFQSLYEITDKHTKPDYENNSMLRRKLREHKKKNAALLQEGQQRGLAIPLVEPHESHMLIAKSRAFKSQKVDKFRLAEKIKLGKVANESIFESSRRVRDSSAGLETKALKQEKARRVALEKQSRLRINTRTMQLVNDDRNYSGHSSASADDLIKQSQVSIKKRKKDTKGLSESVVERIVITAKKAWIKC